MNKNVLIIGSGGRENALETRLKENKEIEKIFCAPGNSGSENPVPIDENDFQALLEFAKKNSVVLTIVGPEVPLSKGIVDIFESEGLKIFGPSKRASMIESSKSFARRLMAKYGIPQPDFKVFKDAEQAFKHIRNSSSNKIVVKASDLAAGKGAFVCDSNDEALKAVFEINSRFGGEILIEERLKGYELSIFAITDGERAVYLQPAQDYKRAFDGDSGPNTGGMGAVSPVLGVNKELMKKIDIKIIRPILMALKKDGAPYKGCLYAGLMIDNGEPKVIEFNCRFGDPETQAILPILKSDLFELLFASSCGDIDGIDVEFSDEASCCVTVCSKGYPGKYETGFEIKGLSDIHDKDIFVFHAGTRSEEGKILTNGGRVFNIVGLGEDLDTARRKAYGALENIHFDGMFYREDIGLKNK